jgi:hypothetical protein
VPVTCRNFEILFLISLSPSLEIWHPKYLNSLTCSKILLLIVILQRTGSCPMNAITLDFLQEIVIPNLFKVCSKYIIVYSGVTQNVRAQAGVMLWIHKSMKNQILHYTFWNERILEIKLKINRGMLTFFSLYAPEEGTEKEGENFYNLLQEAMNKVF